MDLEGVVRYREKLCICFAMCFMGEIWMVLCACLMIMDKY
jgi:hypothetical protein